MLVGDPTAKIDRISSGHWRTGGMLPTNFQGFTPPPVGTPNYFLNSSTPVRRIADFHAHVFHVDFATPANSTLTHLGTYVETLPFRRPQPELDRSRYARSPRQAKGLDGLNRPPHARR